jgi:type III secretion protein V
VNNVFALKRYMPALKGLSAFWLPLGLIAIVSLWLIPMPPLMIDFFIAINLTIGVLLLLTAIYVKKPLDFSSFPTVLLLSTMFRLAITVATVRMILVDKHAGAIVQQFGEIVAGGEVIVGLVIFLIMTIIQFIVISKGAERVAEVAARFTLDAMPGKQLSIDSDLRSGLLTKDEAKAKRQMLEEESKFNGSLDGAMKFVKGDSIASIVIVLINLIGGMAVGMINFDMDAGTAIKTFSILTIGDGLVAQIPAFFSAMAAGLLVTRATSEDNEEELAPTIARQILGKPHVLFVASGILVLLGLIPGFPTIVFFSLALLLTAGGLWSHPRSGPAVRAKIGLPDIQVTAPVGQARLSAPAQTAIEPLQLKVAIAPASSEFAALTAELSAIVASVQERSGITLPALHLLSHGYECDTEYSWELSAFDAPLGAGVSGAEDPVRHIGLLTEHLLERNIGLFLGLQEVTDMLNNLGETHPEVVKEALRAVPTGKIAEVLRLLAEEGVPLRNMREAIEAIGDIGQYERDAAPIAERVRIAMRRHIVAPLCQNGRLPALMVGSEVENLIRGTLTEIDGQMRLAISPLQMRSLIALLTDQIQQSGAKAILTSQDLRRPLRLLIAGDLHAVAVLSFNELNPAVPLDIVGEINRAPESLTPDSRMIEIEPEYAE